MIPGADLIWSLHLGSTWFMTGLIWLIQVVHYPLMRYALGPNFNEFHLEHSRRITWVVLPMMSLELMTGAILFFNFQSYLGFWRCGLPLFFSTMTFFGTALFFIPLHDQLQRGPSQNRITRLVRANRLRTLIWTVHSIFLIVSNGRVF